MRFLPDPGRWQAEGLPEGTFPLRTVAPFGEPPPPPAAVPLPVPGRNG